VLIEELQGFASLTPRCGCIFAIVKNPAAGRHYALASNKLYRLMIKPFKFYRPPPHRTTTILSVAARW